MPMHQAIRMCRHRAVVVTPRREVYKAASRKIFGIIARFADVLEQISIDEGFAEPVVLAGREGEGVEAARRWASDLQKTVEEETGLPCSIGMAATKMDAKMASDLAKPHGIFVVDPALRAEVFDERPVGKCGELARLRKLGCTRWGWKRLGSLFAWIILMFVPCLVILVWSCSGWRRGATLARWRRGRGLNR